MMVTVYGVAASYRDANDPVSPDTWRRMESGRYVSNATHVPSLPVRSVQARKTGNVYEVQLDDGSWQTINVLNPPTAQSTPEYMFLTSPDVTVIDPDTSGVWS